MINTGKGQSVLAYTILIIIIASALIAMRTYFLRAVQEKYRQTADVFGGGEQYDPAKTKIIVNR